MKILLLDPLYRGPLFGSLFMSVSAALMGVFLFVRRKTLLGETLSHATYPGVVFGAFVAAFLGLEEGMSLFILGGGFLTGLFATSVLSFLKKKRVKKDAALTATLASFFGVGVLFSSLLQSFYPKHLKAIHGYVYGQAASMTDGHIVLYGGLSALVFICVMLFYKELKALSFDAAFFQVSLKSVKKIDTLFLFLVVLGTVIGIRSVGVVLLSGMLIAPAVAARQYTERLEGMLVVGVLIALFSTSIGTLLSFSWAFPQGPLIVLTASLFALFALLFAPKRGLAIRYARIVHFRMTCVSENLLKYVWRQKRITLKEAQDALSIPYSFLAVILWVFRLKKWVQKEGKNYVLQEKGNVRGSRIVRLHRLWEVYLVKTLGMNVERVHKSAEEMEHILTPALERELTALLNDPTHDPHDQPIPGGSYV